MFLHLGADQTVPLRDIVAILHLEERSSLRLRQFLSAAKARRLVVTVPDGPAKSMVIAVDAHMCHRVFLSPISPKTLRARCVLPARQSF